jgi:hypothetical protein
MTRTIRLMGLIAALAVLIATGPLPDAPYGARTSSAYAEGYIATLDPVSGLVQHQTAQDNPHDPAGWQTVTGPILVSEGDRIRTGVGALAYLTFFEGIDTAISESALVVVSTLSLPETDADSLDISLDVLVGVTFSSIDAMLDAEDRFEIHTPSATAAVRGTRWWTIVTPRGESAFATERGTVEVILREPQPLPSPDLSSGAAAVPPAVGGEADESSADTGEPPVAAAPAPVSPAIDQVALNLGNAIIFDEHGQIANYLEDLEINPLGLGEFDAPLASADCGNAMCDSGETESCPVDCLDQVTFATCGDSDCDLDAGEDLLVCAADCAPWPGAACGNDTCDADESGITCPADCESGEYFSPLRPEQCGNGTCDATESALACPADCARADESEGESGDDQGACRFTVTIPSANLRAGPGTGQTVVGTAFAGESFDVSATHTGGAWVKIEDGVWIALSVGDLSGDCASLLVSGAAVITGEDSGEPGDDSVEDGGEDSGDDGDDSPDDGTQEALDDDTPEPPDEADGGT